LEYRVVSATCGSLQSAAVLTCWGCRSFQLLAITCSRLRETFNPKVVGSIPTRPIEEVTANRWFFTAAVESSKLPEYEWSTRSDWKGAFHLGCLDLAFGTFPVAIDVGRHLQRGVTEVAGQPRDLSATLKRALRERVSEAMERSLLQRRTWPLDTSCSHCWVKVPPQHDGRREKPTSVVSRKDEVFDCTAVLVAPTGEEIDDVRDEINVTAFAILRCSHHAAGIARSNADHGLFEIDIGPT
jgi:hypothetical protein